MSKVSYAPYIINPNIFTTTVDGELVNKDDFEKAFSFVAPTEAVIVRYLGEVKNYLSHGDAKKSSLDWVLMQLKLHDKPQTIKVSAIDDNIKKIYSEIQYIDESFKTTVRTSKYGIEFINKSQEVYDKKRHEYMSALNRLSRYCGPSYVSYIVPEFDASPSKKDYHTIVELVKAFYTYQSYLLTDANVSIPDRTKYDIINSHVPPKLGEQQGQSLTELLLKNMLYISATHRDIADTDIMRAYDLFNMLTWRVFPVIEIMLVHLEKLHVEARKVQASKFLEMLHSRDKSILSMNQNLIQYLEDIGLDSATATALSDDIAKPGQLDEVIASESAATGTTALVIKLHHYANDLYQTYKLIIRDTVLYQFRSSVASVPKIVADKWNTVTQSSDMHIQKYSTYESFLNELLFIHLTEPLIAEDVKTYDGIKRVLESTGVQTYSECLISTALGPDMYISFLKEAALDSNVSTVQIRVETLLKYMALYSFNNLQNDLQVALTEEYKSIVLVLDAVAKKLVGMQQIIFTVFNLLHLHRNVFMDNEQIHSGEVLTFVKIRNDNNDFGNRRFDIMLDKDSRSMLLKYEDVDEPCYQTLRDYKTQLKIAKAQNMAENRYPLTPAKAFYKNINSTIDVMNKKAIALAKAAAANPKPVRRGQSAPAPSGAATMVQNVATDWPDMLDESIADEAYDTRLKSAGGMVVPRGPRSTYMFGPFTRIYRPHETAKDIVSNAGSGVDMNKTVVDRLKHGQNVCIFGYGQSGSGKTSLLIYFKTRPDDSGEDGIMSRICEQLINDFSEIEVTIREVGVTTAGTSGAIIRDENPFYKPKKFVPLAGKWVMDEYQHKGLPVLPRLIPIDGEPANINPDKLKEIAPYAFFCTENNRLARATTNNPTSSRTHIFIFLKFKPKHGSALRTAPTLIIGDFAGVENRFACNQSSVLKSFSKIKYDNRNELVYRQVIDANYIANIGDLLNTAKIGEINIGGVVISELETMIESKLAPIENISRLIKNIDMLRERTTAELSAGKTFDNSVLGRAIKAAVVMNGMQTTLNSLKILKGPVLTNMQPVYNTFIQSSPDCGLVYSCIFKNMANVDNANIAINIGWNSTVDANNILNMVAGFPYNKIDHFLYWALKSTSELGMGVECKYRVDEGDYINKSLEVFRMFLSDSLKRKGAVPKIINQCGAIQCNPFYSDCYGSLYSSIGAEIDEIEEVLVEAIDPTLSRSLPGLGAAERYMVAQKALADLTYCVFNVINISKDRNDPPPTPFIDSTPIVFEYNRMSSYPTRVTDPAFRVPVGPNDFNAQLLVDLRSNTINHMMLSGTEFEGVKGNIVKLINQAISSKNSGDTKYLEKVRNMIDEFDKVNAPTFIGTMVFTDNLAKFGINRMMCVLESDAYAKGKNNFIDNMVYGQLSKLIARSKFVHANKLLKSDNSFTNTKKPVDESNIAKAIEYAPSLGAKLRIKK